MIMKATVTGLIFIAMGAFTMLGAVLNWSVVNRPRKLFNIIFGDTVARVIYFIAGVFLFLVGVGRLIGANWF